MCDDNNCPLSHVIDTFKMPVCSYFLRGICTNESCPYSHVNVNPNAAICEAFLNGYCPDGEKCKLKHIIDCPNFIKDGNCPLGNQCKLRHYIKKKKIINK